MESSSIQRRFNSIRGKQVETTLGNFFAGMALDPLRLAEFLERPDTTMKEAHLSEEAQVVVRSGDPELIWEQLRGERGAPASAPWNCPGLMDFFY